MLPFAIEYEGRLVGQLTVAGITWGSMCSGHVGYWVDQEVAGRGVMPTAVALAVDHCFRAVGLHRIEVCIRPENGPSSAGRGETRIPRGGDPAPLSAHRRRLAGPPDLRAHRGGGARRPAPEVAPGASGAPRAAGVPLKMKYVFEIDRVMTANGRANADC